ncbi:hypothetical protein Lepto7375DRAFT_0482 [Leptolyngbya sp. PCC 7375]|nr:hypothetical protein Lepto7375DRAFT_0482 [Leptolyngbya sp. PCC 7375]
MPVDREHGKKKQEEDNRFKQPAPYIYSESEFPQIVSEKKFSVS